jgi:hypothetical protein
LNRAHLGRSEPVLRRSGWRLVLRDRNPRMPRAEMKTSSKLVITIALRHLGIEREVLVLKAKGEDFYAFLPGSLSGLGHCKIHFSFHGSGRRHMVVESRTREDEWDEEKWPRRGAEPTTMREQTKVQLQRPAAIRGAQLFGHCGILYGQFPDLHPVGTSPGELIVLDAQDAHFRDDYTIARAYVVEPGCDAVVVAERFAGPRVVYVEKRTAPWIVAEIFQLSNSAFQ